MVFVNELDSRMIARRQMEAVNLSPGSIRLVDGQREKTLLSQVMEGLNSGRWGFIASDEPVSLWQRGPSAPRSEYIEAGLGWEAMDGLSSTRQGVSAWCHTRCG